MSPTFDGMVILPDFTANARASVILSDSSELVRSSLDRSIVRNSAPENSTNVPAGVMDAEATSFVLIPRRSSGPRSASS